MAAGLDLEAVVVMEIEMDLEEVARDNKDTEPVAPNTVTALITITTLLMTITALLILFLLLPI